MSWASDLNKLTKNGSKDLDTLARFVKFRLFERVVDLTRVKEGLLRGNWQIQDGAPVGKAIDRLDPTGEIVVAEVRKKVTGNGKTYFTNHLPYAKPREEEDAMVGRSVVLVRNEVKEQVKRLRR